jgi:hypothetical protein
METHFVPKSSRTNTPFSTYQMIGIAEGFEECDNHEVQIEAWASIGQKGLYTGLQGFFGRTLQRFIDEEILFDDFTINWDMVDEMAIYGGD